MGMRLRSLGPWVLAGSALAAPASAQVDGALAFDQKFLGLIDSPLDVDLVELQDVKGSRLSVTVTAGGGNSLHPGLSLLDGAMTPIDLGDALKTKKKKVKLKKFELPASGTYFLRVSSTNALTGTYKVKVGGKPPKSFEGSGAIGAPGEIDELEFAARAGAVLSGEVERTGGDVEPFAVELVGPGGALVAIAGGVQSGEGVLSLAGIGLPSVGDYRLRVTGASGTVGDYAWKLKVAAPDPVKGKVFEDGHPQDDGAPSDGFTLEQAIFGRGLRTVDGLGMDVVSPYSLVQTDPISDRPVPGSLKPLFPAGDLDVLVSFQLGALYGPPVLPRNAAVVLRFTGPPDPASLRLDDEGRLTDESPVRVVVNDQPVTFEVFVDGHDLILNPSFGDQVAMPASPLAFDAAGNPTADSAGVGHLALVGTGPFPLRSSSGSVYEPRPDLLGSLDAGGSAIGFNPGNQALDFFEQTDVGVGSKGYGGFLPDETPPRLIRELRLEETYDPDFANPAAGDTLGPDLLGLVRDEPFNDEAKGGLGEWAGGILRLRPDGPHEEEIVILRNTVLPLPEGGFRNDLHLAQAIVIPPAVGGAVELARAEYYEPDPAHPIDPLVFDVDNPELEANTDIAEFVEVRDRNGAIADVHEPVDALASFTFRFSEPMRPESFRPYETFFVSDDPQIDNFGLNFVGLVETEDGGKAMTFRPHREVQFGPLAGTTQPVGFGVESKALRLHLRTVPPADVLAGLLGEDDYDAFEREGHRGVTDLGGQPLAFPLAFPSVDQPVVDYSLAFVTKADAALTESGAVVQRFLGQPTTGFDTAGDPGIAYRDVPETLCANGDNLYGPRLADLNLFTNGFLSGAPVQFFTKVHDDFNPPLDIEGNETQLGAFPFGTSTPIGGFSVLGGARMQHVYRPVDASPDWEALAGTNLDLVRISYAPIGGFVTNTVLPDISIHAGHSQIVPDTRQGGGIPSHPNSGLVGDMAANYGAVEAQSGVAHDRQVVLGAPDGVGGFTGVPFAISNASTYFPPGTQRAYHPFPEFTTPFAYNNGVLDQATFSAPKYGNPPTTWGGQKGDQRPQSLLLEYRVTAVDPANPPATQNGFTFAVGVLSSAVPRFRVYTIGTGCLSCCFNGPGGCAANCLISFGPPMDGMNGSAPPLDPDTITHAAGPAPAPPSLPCFCLRPPQNAQTAPAGCTDTTLPAPTIDQVAQGLAPNPSAGNTVNNFGDNSRYFMTFDYVKRESLFRSPFVRAQPAGTGPAAVTNPFFLAPILDPPLDSIPDGTSMQIRFRASPTGGVEGLDATAWVTPEEMAAPDSALNQTPGTPYIQFEVAVEANTSTQLTPVLDEVVVPFERP